MTAWQPLVTVFAGVATALVVATAIARLLAQRVTTVGTHAVIENLNARIDAWWFMVAALALAFAFGMAGIVVLFAVLSFLALREFATRSCAQPSDHPALVVAFFIVLPLQYYCVATAREALFATLIPVCAFLVLPMLSAVRGQTTQFLARLAEIQWGVMLCVFCLSHVPALLILEIPEYEGKQPLLVMYLLLIAQASDVLQYVYGKLFGKRKIAPNLSPGKTVAGVVGGIGSATLLGVAVSALTPFEPWQAGLVALAIAVVGFLGGLVMSAIKRSVGTKDWGWAIRGHGGVLDRIDSVAFAAPVFFYVVRSFWAG